MNEKESQGATPESDAFEDDNQREDPGGDWMIGLPLLRKLERQRDEARGQVQEQAALCAKAIRKLSETKNQWGEVAEALEACLELLEDLYCLQGRHETVLVADKARAALAAVEGGKTVPAGWHEVTVGESRRGDMWWSETKKAWEECGSGIGCGNVATIIRKSHEEGGAE